LNKLSKNPSTALLQQSTVTRQAILAAALKAFARYGFDGASLPKIAKMAQVAPTLIHYHFGSKDNLWRETVDNSLGELRREVSAIQSATRALAPLARLRALLQAITHFAARCPDHFSMTIAEARSESDRFAWLQKTYNDVLYKDIVSILKEAKNTGQIKDVDVDQLWFMLIGGILLYFTVNTDLPKDKDLDKIADRYTDRAFKIFLEGISTTVDSG
jgi:TetR/AcrR family transcriptional regulator